MTSNEIRLLEPYEAALLIPGARAFFAEGNVLGTLNEKHFVTSLAQRIESGAQFVLVAGFPFRGAIGGVLYQDLATAGTCAFEHFWFVHPEERGSLGMRLLAAWEAEATKRGATRLDMAHYANERTKEFSNVYEKRGYVLKEQIFTKQVQQ